MPEDKGEYLQYGGQAIIEGVMMRSPRHFAVAVRAPNGEIVVHAEPLEKTWIGRQQWLKLPFLRGTLALLDAMALGYKALKFSTDVQMNPKYEPKPEEDEGIEVAVSKDGEALQEAIESGEVVDEKGMVDTVPLSNAKVGKSKVQTSEKAIQSIAVGGALVFGLGLGFFLFNYLPNFLATLLRNFGVESMTLINFTTEIIKVVFFLGYILLISLMPEIKKVFKYHGAEHKAINTLEADEELTLENCKRQTRLHPRCGTSFAIIVLLVGMVLFTILPKPQIPDSRFLESIARVAFEIPFLFPIAGISYELLRWAGKMKDKRLMKALFWPGLMTQYLTTREPDPDQIEVALVSLQAVVEAENADKAVKEEPAQVLEDVIS